MRDCIIKMFHNVLSIINLFSFQVRWNAGDRRDV